MDIEVVAAPTAELTLNAAVTFLDAKYDSFPGGSCIFPATRTATVLGGNATVICEQGGYRMIRSPKVSGNIGVTYRRDTSFGEILANLTDVYTGSYVFDASGRLKQPATHLVSGSLTWTSADGKYEAQLWGKNLLDEFHYQVAFEAGNDIYSPAEPRTFGVRLGVHY